MFPWKRTLAILAVAVGWALLAAQPAQAAYIDPNTGGMLFQALAAFFALISGMLLVFSSRLRMAAARLWRRVRERRAGGPEGSAESPGD